MFYQWTALVLFAASVTCLQARVKIQATCATSPCGLHSRCEEIGPYAKCSCLTGFTGYPPLCRLEDTKMNRNVTTKNSSRLEHYLRTSLTNLQYPKYVSDEENRLFYLIVISATGFVLGATLIFLTFLIKKSIRNQQASLLSSKHTYEMTALNANTNEQAYDYIPIQIVSHYSARELVMSNKKLTSASFTPRLPERPKKLDGPDEIYAQCDYASYQTMR